MVRHSDFFLGASPEHARIDPEQLLILLDHVRCAAFELPFTDGERFGNTPTSTELLAYLEDEQLLHHEGGRWHWMADSYPANAVGLRTVAEGNFVVVDITDGGKRVIAEVDYSGAPMTLYEGAIYMLQARPWQVETIGLGRTQGICARNQCRLLYRGHRLHASQGAGDLRGRETSNPLPAPTVRCISCAAWPALQEDPLLQSRERRLRQRQSSRPGNAHYGRMVESPPPCARSTIQFTLASSGRLSRRRSRHALRGRHAEHVGTR